MASQRRCELGGPLIREEQPPSVDRDHLLGLIRDALGYAAEGGRIEHRHVDTFAHIALAAANEVAMMVARADDPAAALGACESAFAEFLDRLLGGPPAPVAG